jgi:hypothetical protein
MQDGKGQGQQYAKMKVSIVRNGAQVLARNETYVFGRDKPQELINFFIEWVNENFGPQKQKNGGHDLSKIVNKDGGKEKEDK